MNNSSYASLTLGRVFIVFAVFVATLATFLLFSDKAHAADDGEFVWFRIDTELNDLLSEGGTLTIRWYCDGASSFGQVNDNTASESTNARDGIIKVASASAEMTAASCTIGESETLRASASIDGWVVREWTNASFPGASTSSPFTTYASLDFNIVINGVDDELGTAITLDGSSASASYNGTTASESYRGGKKYIAGSTSGGTVTAEADGYVKATSSGTLTVSGTASQSIDFGTGDDSDVDESGLSFGHKVRVYESGGDFTNNKFTTGTVTAGDSFGTTCTNNSDGNWYCSVPLANTGTSAKFVLTGYDTTSVTYTDRTSDSDAQVSTDITPPKTAPSGGGGSIADAASPTPTPTATPEVFTQTTPEPTPTSEATTGIMKLYRKDGDPKVYVQKDDGLHWVKTLEEFNASNYKWSDVKIISVNEFTSMSFAPGEMSSPQLYRKVNDPKVYVVGSDGTLRWIRTLAEFNAAGYNWADVKIISGEEFAKMRVGGTLKVLSNISFLRVRQAATTSSSILGQLSPDQQIDFWEISNGWYKVKLSNGTTGWVSGDYVTEI
ncbi:MAG TPA: SH3 domain-containing protein [Candidatus Paceibacterota bacterium]